VPQAQLVEARSTRAEAGRVSGAKAGRTCLLLSAWGWLGQEDLAAQLACRRSCGVGTTTGARAERSSSCS